MKTLYQILSTVFLTVGACIGAGFITGRETVTFFGTENFIPYLIFAGVIFALSLTVGFSASSVYPSLTAFNGALFKRTAVFDTAVRISCFLSVCTMLSALDTFTATLNFLRPFPLFSTVALLIVGGISRFGVSGARILNFIATPLMLILVNIIAFTNGNLNVTATATLRVDGVIKGFLFVTLNTFMNLPSFVDGARGKGLTQNVIVALLSSAIITVQAGVILATVKGHGGDLSASPMPFFTAINNPSLTVLFSAVCTVGIFTSLSTAYYPLHAYAKTKFKRGGGLVVMTACLLFSRLGIKNIVDYAYPLIGAFGTVYLIKCIIYLKKEKWKVKRKGKSPLKQLKKDRV